MAGHPIRRPPVPAGRREACTERILLPGTCAGLSRRFRDPCPRWAPDLDKHTPLPPVTSYVTIGPASHAASHSPWICVSFRRSGLVFTPDGITMIRLDTDNGPVRCGGFRILRIEGSSGDFQHESGDTVHEPCVSLIPGIRFTPAGVRKEAGKGSTL